jgi:hypothetical protein
MSHSGRLQPIVALAVILLELRMVEFGSHGG